MLRPADGGGKRKRAEGLCPFALSHQEIDFPGPLNNFVYQQHNEGAGNSSIYMSTLLGCLRGKDPRSFSLRYSSFTSLGSTASLSAAGGSRHGRLNRLNLPPARRQDMACRNGGRPRHRAGQSVDWAALFRPFRRVQHADASKPPMVKITLNKYNEITY